MLFTFKRYHGISKDFITSSFTSSCQSDYHYSESDIECIKELSSFGYEWSNLLQPFLSYSFFDLILQFFKANIWDGY